MMQRIRWMVLGGLLTLLLVAAGSLAALRIAPGRSLGDYFFGPKLARIEAIMVDGGQTLDYRIDRGRVSKNPSSGNLELKELDGTVQVVPVSPTAQVLINGKPGTVAQVGRGMLVIAIRQGSGPAQQVIAQGGRTFGR